jgi:tRNA/rRNA methyltransferase
MSKGKVRRRVAAILVEPHDDANIGSAARALKNCGFSDLRIVRAQPPGERAAWTAAGAADVLQQLRCCATFDEAVRDVDHLVAFTARNRRYGPPIQTWTSAAGARLAAHAESATVGLLFGPEPSGLEQRHVEACAEVFTIPSSPARPAFNLAQAVLLACHAIAFPGGEPARPSPRRRASAPGGRREIDALMQQFSSRLADFGYKPPRTPHDRTARILARLRAQFERAGLDERDLAMWKGLLARLRH